MPKVRARYNLPHLTNTPWPSVEAFLRCNAPDDYHLESLTAMFGRLLDVLSARGALRDDEVTHILAGFAQCTAEVCDE